MKDDLFRSLVSTGGFSPLDLHFAALMGRLNGGEMPESALAAAMVSSATGQGHICLDLRRLDELPLEDDLRASLPAGAHEWLERLRQCPVVGLPGDYRPLILDESGRLYLYRYWEYERKLADALRARMEKPPEAHDPSRLKERLERLFPRTGNDVDWQKVAAFSSVWKTFCVVSGGPGTGKTTTVAKILALIIEQGAPGQTRIALAAPTGKAAARLQEAIKSAKDKLDCEEWVKAAVPESASTIHRLLGSMQGSPYFRHNAENPLPVDLLVVDEASMVALPLMSKLLDALPRQARLILLGDKDQLSSVEAGAVLGDICATGEGIAFSGDFATTCEKACGFALEKSFLLDSGRKKPADCIIQLQKSYRFSGESGIALLSRKVRENDVDGAALVLHEGKYPDLAWNPVSSCGSLQGSVGREVTEGFGGYLEEVRMLGRGTGTDPRARLAKVFERFENFRILCALREGYCGVSALNRLAESVLEEADLLRRARKWYAGRPVMIKRNDYTLRLFNGDIGIFLPDIVSGSDYRVFFPGPEGTFRPFHPLRLPEHETVFAMTVHKSQGSEFDNVLLILPDRDTPVLTRELIYTGVTRARKRVSLWGSELVLRSAILRSTERHSGLSEALWG